MAHSEGFQKLAADAKTRIKEIAVDRLIALETEQKPVIIDVREESEWNVGHAEGSIHLSRGIIEQKIEEVVTDPNTPIICYCGGGNRSALVADSLQKIGYTNVFSLEGGFRAWQDADLPITKPE
ncbi:MAG: rhodanese-like domain-containing protein [Pseudanabaenaceae cyanobacterium]|jgi:rhodanese-related sulfurtransferase